MMSKFFIEHPILANVIAVVIVVIGLVAMRSLPVAQYPNIVPPTVVVTASYPGASPQTVIDNVALPIELQVNGVDNMLYMSSTSAADGSYQLIVTFKIGTDPDMAQVLVQNRVSNALSALPAAVQSQGVNVQKKSTAILQIIALDSPKGTFDASFLSNYATINLVNELARLHGVANVTVFGAAKYAMRVWMDPRKLYSFGLTPQDVSAAINQQSQLVAAGQTGMPPAAKNQDFQYTVDIRSRFNDPEEFGNIIVKSEGTVQGGRLVRIKDIGRVELGSQNYSQQCKLNDRPAGCIAIFQTPDANALQVSQEVRDKMAELARRFPQDLQYTLPLDTTDFVKTSINEVYTTLYEAGILVLVVILVFLQNFRATLVPATTVPVTIIGAFAGMAALGYSINISTLFGVVLAIGIVVDDAIVIVEGASKYIEQGMSGHDASIRAMKELFGPIIGITLVLMAVFIPPAFLPGLSGKMLAQFAVVIATTALISAINAATLKPTQCAQWLRPQQTEKTNAFYRAFNIGYNYLEEIYIGFVGVLVARSKTVVLIGLAISALAVWGIARLPKAFIPTEDQGYLIVVAQLPEGASLERTANTLSEAASSALSTPGVKSVITIAGVSVLDNNAVLANAGVAYLRLDDWDAREKAKDQDIASLMRIVQQKLGTVSDGRAVVVAPPAIQGIGNADGFQMQVNLLGGSFDYAKLGVAAQNMVKNSSADAGLQRPSTTFQANSPHVGLNVDRVQAETVKVSVGDVFSALTSYVGSSYVSQFTKFGQVLQVYVQADSQFRLQPEDLLNMYVRGQDGNMVAIGTLAQLTQTSAPPLITLFNLYPSATITGSPASGVSSGQAMDKMEDIAAKTLSSDMGYEWSAVSYQEKITGNLLYLGFAMSVLLVYLVLAGQYESWLLPLAVIVAVPLALVGPALTLTSLGINNNLYVQIGLMLLIALSAKNGILIVEVAREMRLNDGKPILESAVDAARSRFRPILMTSIAFILGVLPLVLATGAGANSRRSLGTSVFTGMISSTVLAVLLVPAFFVVLQTLDERWRGNSPTRKKTEPKTLEEIEAEIA
ncbi:efflux RND transporter permease subunit [Methylocystis sp. MJC1]|jgi:HAE1 family hydrophobic/amphiphilic exporter-1|uniref:efflux RND transporter permease subunit n=1 Tax=Methylocystis sp. MJC1 TaxID=2654282 RepID=UPI0013E9EB73|nr:efflux RND transporter permease subunit [Methylocystis sp. MJC1]KAF2989913.1 Efflux pump membrane transporter BepE [Methylocystis sp. MJC1]MBU6528319.1 efflux RND transporter permease subunit [Methylocystis sp. MJC1]UZX11224.1 efflux RND transporter permease subunit [Methylocystis sp. MJC1]